MPASSGDPDQAFGLIPDAADGPERVALTTERAARLKEALDTLPLIQRLPIELAFFEGLTHVEVSERLEVPLGTIKTRIRLGLLAFVAVLLTVPTRVRLTVASLLAMLVALLITIPTWWKR